MLSLTSNGRSRGETVQRHVWRQRAVLALLARPCKTRAALVVRSGARATHEAVHARGGACAPRKAVHDKGDARATREAGLRARLCKIRCVTRGRRSCCARGRAACLPCTVHVHVHGRACGYMYGTCKV